MPFPVYTPENKPVGLAIHLDRKTDPEIVKRLAVVNSGYVPQYDEAFHGGEYFVILFEDGEPNLVIPAIQFEKRWAFIYGSSDSWLTPIIEL